jgi:hypothetical protein
MKVYKLEVMVIDFDGLGADAIKETIENQKYPNYCISPTVKGIDGREIGEWADAHPLNHRDTADVTYQSLFAAPQPE